MLKSGSSWVRPATQAGRFYPSSPVRLQADVKDYLEQAEPCDAGLPKALIVPHAGYVYSGEVAALGFIRLGPAHERVRRVILIGPSHYADFEGLAATRARAFATPLGEVRVEEEALDELDGMPQVRVFEEAHGPEHALEVELPFLQAVLDEFSIVPLLVGRADAGEVGEVLDRLWGGPETCVVVSSDLSHYLDQTAARQKDRATAEAIMGLDTRALDATSACGYRAIAGLLEVVRARGLRGETIALRTSADAGGTRDRVVGYGAFAFETTEAQAAGRGR